MLGGDRNLLGQKVWKKKLILILIIKSFWCQRSKKKLRTKSQKPKAKSRKQKAKGKRQKAKQKAKAKKQKAKS